MRNWARDWVTQLCAERAGLRLTGEAVAAIESRLAPLARREGFGAVDEMLTRARDRDDTRLSWLMIEAMSPAPGGFFRAPAAFDDLCDVVLPGMAPPGQPLRIWIVGCGAGQEAYALAMALMEREMQAGVDILATDLSEARLQKAQAGVYSAYEVQCGLSARRLVRWFEPHAGEYLLSPQLRAAVRWGRFNAMDSGAALGRFDVILCRGVMDALTDAGRERLATSLAQSILPEGRLMMDAAEAAPAGWKPVAGAPGMFTAAAGARLAA